MVARRHVRPDNSLVADFEVRLYHENSGYMNNMFMSGNREYMEFCTDPRCKRVYLVDKEKWVVIFGTDSITASRDQFRMRKCPYHFHETV